jgi:hypothetical protein
MNEFTESRELFYSTVTDTIQALSALSDNIINITVDNRKFCMPISN